ncbi:MAG: DUF2092 domain-containing protein [Lacunisphaera sp.]
MNATQPKSPAAKCLRFARLLAMAGVIGAASLPLAAQNKSTAADDAVVREKEAKALGERQNPAARALLDEAKARLKSLQSLVVDYEATRGASTKNFDKQSEVSLERPNKFRIEAVNGAVVEERSLLAVSDGQTVTTINEDNFAAFEKPVRAENFFLGQNFLVQFFFDPRGIAFDPTDGLWGRAVSLFDSNLSAYDKDTRLALLGERTLEGCKYTVVEIKYNTDRTDIRQQIYVGEDKLVYRWTLISTGRFTPRNTGTSGSTGDPGRNLAARKAGEDAVDRDRSRAPGRGSAGVHAARRQRRRVYAQGAARRQEGPLCVRARRRGGPG